MTQLRLCPACAEPEQAKLCKADIFAVPRLRLDSKLVVSKMQRSPRKEGD
jgi:hypothetical protein